MKKSILISIIGLGLTATSCDSYLDINQDPNSPAAENVTSSMLFPTTEMNLATSYGNTLRIQGGYLAQHYSQEFGTSNYLAYSRFNMSGTSSGRVYNDLNVRVIKNASLIVEKAKAAEDWGALLAATVMRAFAYQALVDCYGEVPYTESMDATNVSPKYDEGKDIYAGILAELDEALSHVKGTEAMPTNFLFPGKKADTWVKFANSLKLRLLMRESGTVDVQAQLDKLVADDNFITSDVAYQGCWKNESGQMNPFYAEEFSTAWGSTQINVILNIALQATMQQVNADGDIVYEDPRLAAWFNKNSSGNFTGGVSGTNFSTAAETYPLAYWCRPVASFDMPVYLMTMSEVKFFLAEYYAKKGNSAAAEAAYKEAVSASFATAGVSGADENLAKYPYNQNNYKQVIGLAKWIALSGVNNFEAFCELRRLKYPTFGTVTGEDLFNETKADYHPELYVPGTLYTPITVNNQVGANKLLQRFAYPENSTSRNSKSPEFKGYTTPIFWAEN